MLISCAMIQDALDSVLTNFRFNDLEHQLNLKRILTYEEESILRSDTVYLMPEEFSTLPHMNSLVIEKGASVILWVDMDLASLSNAASWLILDPARTTYAHVLNQITRLFEKYNDFEFQLKDMLYSGQELAQLLAHASRILKNELTVRNENYQIIARSFTELMEMKKSDLPQPDDRGIYSPAVMKLLERDPAYHAIMTGVVPANEIIHYYSKDIGTNSLFIDLYVKDLSCYRVRLSDSRQPFRPYDPALLKYLAGFIEEKLNQMYFLSERWPKEKNILKSLLYTSHSCTQQELDHLKECFGWHTDQNYVCVCMMVSKGSSNLKMMTYYGLILERSFPGLFYCEFDDMIVTVIDLDVSFQGSLLELNHELVYFLRDENLRAGYSLVFKDLMDLKYYYNQASIALRMGEKHQPHIWTHYFQDHIYHWLENTVTELFGDGLICDPALQILCGYDEEKNGELLETLRCYLDNRMNAVRTAEKLFIHRATLNYRLQRIADMTGLCFQDNSHMLLLQLLLTLHGMRPD